MAVLLSPIGNGAQFFTIGGLPLSGGLLWTYQAGTSTPQPSYTTSVGNIANANPIVLGPDGRPPAEIWLTQGVAYKFSLLDSLSNPISSYDNILGINDFNSVNIPGTLTVAGNTILTNLSVTGNTTLGDAPGDALTVNPANVSWPGNPTHSGNHTFSGTVTIPGGAIGLGPITNFSALTPTSFAGTNVPTVAVETGSCKGVRIGDIVVGGLTIDVDPTATNTQSGFSITPPIASNFTSGLEVQGTAIQIFSTGIAATAGVVTADTVNKRLSVSFYSGGDNANRLWQVNFVYQIIP